ncbi:MAG: fibronectin type III domain-containing protein [Treponema sp.]|nr:fibronectin type III domain-containing protein [Treponema sp.]
MKANKKFAFALSLILPLLATSCADMFQEKIPMNINSGNSSLAELLVEKTPVTELDAPSQIFVSQGDNGSTITVSWSAVENAQSYRLERAISTTRDSSGNFEEPSEGDFQTITTGVGSTAYIYDTTYYEDKILSDPNYLSDEYGYKYFYRVMAENITKGYGSSEYTDPAGGTLFAPPSETSASAGKYKDKIEITWAKSSSTSTTGYDIYRSKNSDGSSSTKIGSVKSNMTSYVNKIDEADRGTEYYYTVYAKNRIGESSVASSIAMGYAQADGAPIQVTDVHVTEGRGFNNSDISIAWSGDSETHYTVYRTSSKDSALTMLAADKSGSLNYTYTDSENLVPGIYYYYLVQSWKLQEDGTKIKGQMSDSGSKSKTPAEGFILSPPTGIVISKTGSGHQISWEPSIGGIAEKQNYIYKVYGSETANGSFSPVASFIAAELMEYEGKYTAMLSTTSKYCMMTTINGSAESSPSEVAAPAPYAPRSITVSAYANLSSEMGSSWVANNNGVYPVKITWTPPAESDDVAGYYVYRSEKKNKGWKLLSVNNDEKTFMVTGNTFYDINVSARTKKIYYYRVLSLNSLQGGANYSDIKWGYGALTAAQYMREYNFMVKGSQKKLKLMWKSGSTDKLGQETAYGTLGGSLSYDAHISGTSGRVIMHYSDYADYYIHTNGKIDASPLDSEDEIIGTANGLFLLINGNTNTSAGMDMAGSMDGTVTCKGMYPGSVGYDGVQIKGGAAGGGYYKIKREGFADENVSWTVGEE